MPKASFWGGSEEKSLEEPNEIFSSVALGGAGENLSFFPNSQKFSALAAS